MKIIVTGASGVVGSKLVRFLADQGHSLLLLGREPDALRAQFDGFACESYAQVTDSQLVGYECCIHLATRNLQQSGDDASFQADNVETLGEFCAKLKNAGVLQQIYFSTILAAPDSPTAYGRSKWQAEQLISSIGNDCPGWTVEILRPGYIHSEIYQSRLAFLGHLPRPFAKMTFLVVSALYPVVDYDELEARVADILTRPAEGRTTLVKLTNKQAGNWIYFAARWLLDACFVLAVALLLNWLMILVFIGIKLESRGPAIFVQPRVGKGGKVFNCYKFRTMKQGTRSAATHEVSRSSITAIGGFLRKTKIDELPQIWNMIRGEMSLIGPRPCLPVQEDLVSWRQKLGVLDVLPGITGFSQINGIDMSDPERLAKADADYIAMRTILFDIRIVLGTLIGSGMQDNVAE